MTNGQKILNRFNKKFQNIAGFDIVDDIASSKREAIQKAKDHIKWFRDWAEESAREMEQEIQKIEYPK